MNENMLHFSALEILKCRTFDTPALALGPKEDSQIVLRRILVIVYQGESQYRAFPSNRFSAVLEG